MARKPRRAVKARTATKSMAIRPGKAASVVRQLAERQQGVVTREAYQSRALDVTFQTMILSLREQEYDCSTLNKAFACAWLNDREVMVATKCNKLLVQDTATHSSRQVELPPEPPRAAYMRPAHQGHPGVYRRPPPPPEPCGIHALAINPSADLLASGGDNPSDCAILSLPDLRPVQTLVGHLDWVFGIAWLTERHIITGSRDHTVKLWEVDASGEAPAANYMYKHSAADHRNKVRDVKYCPRHNRVATLSTNGELKTWDPTFMRVDRTTKLRHTLELVCLELVDGLAAVGSRDYVTLLDLRTKAHQLHIRSPDAQHAVRSANLSHDILSFGTGKGCVHFYDLRARKFLGTPAAAPGGNARTQAPWDEEGCNISGCLQLGRGWLEDGPVYRQYFSGTDVRNACYSMAWDASHTRLLTVGGPLAYGLRGCYMGLWR